MNILPPRRALVQLCRFANSSPKLTKLSKVQERDATMFNRINWLKTKIHCSQINHLLLRIIFDLKPSGQNENVMSFIVIYFISAYL